MPLSTFHTNYCKQIISSPSGSSISKGELGRPMTLAIWLTISSQHVREEILSSLLPLSIKLLTVRHSIRRHAPSHNQQYFEENSAIQEMANCEGYLWRTIAEWNWWAISSTIARIVILWRVPFRAIALILYVQQILVLLIFTWATPFPVILPCKLELKPTPVQFFWLSSKTSFLFLHPLFVKDKDSPHCWLIKILEFKLDHYLNRFCYSCCLFTVFALCALCWSNYRKIDMMPLTFLAWQSVTMWGVRESSQE